MRLNASDLTNFKASAALAPRGPNFIDYSALPNHRGTARRAGKPPRHASYTYIDPSACLLWISSLCGIILSTILSAVMVSRGQPSAGYMLTYAKAVLAVDMQAYCYMLMASYANPTTPKSSRKW